jgi:hypothetical protein
MTKERRPRQQERPNESRPVEILEFLEAFRLRHAQADAPNGSGASDSD